MNKRNQTGFTLYELLIVIVIVGIIASIGIPGLSDFAKNSRITGVANDLHTSFLLARSEAPRIKGNVSICSSENSMVEEPECDNKPDDPFKNGWIVFADVDGNVEFDAGADTVLRRYPAVHDMININTVKNKSGLFSFGPNGMGRSDFDDDSEIVQSIVICDDRGNKTEEGGWSAARFMRITPLGRAVVLRETSQIEAAGGCPD